MTPIATTLRPSDERGHVNIGWLKSRHSFSFGDYYDPNHMGFGPLRVINDDVIAGGGGFPLHPHRNMEIITYMLEGALRHGDSLGNSAVLTAHDVQRMSAGSGIRHSEVNASPTEPVRLLQIWLLPTHSGQPPSYEDVSFSRAEKLNTLRLIASPDGRDGSATIGTDTKVYAAILAPDNTISFALGDGRIGWVQMARGSATMNGQKLQDGDGLAIHTGGPLTFEAMGIEAEFLLFDMAPTA